MKTVEGYFRHCNNHTPIPEMSSSKEAGGRAMLLNSVNLGDWASKRGKGMGGWVGEWSV